MKTRSMSSRKPYLWATLSAGLMLAMTACGGSANVSGDTAGSASAAASKGTIRVGTDATYPPYEYKEQGNFAGLELDLIRAAGEELDKTIEFLDVKYTAGLGGLNANRFDALAIGGTIDAENRQSQVLLVDIFNTSEGLIVKAGNPGNFSTTGSLCGHKVSVFQASEFEQSLKAHNAKCGSNPIDMVALSDASGPYDAITTGRAEAYFGDYVQATAQAKTMGGAEAIKLSDGNKFLGGILVKKENVPMAQELAQGLQKAIDAGKIPAIAAKYGITEADIVSKVTINTGKVPVNEQ